MYCQSNQLSQWSLKLVKSPIWCHKRRLPFHISSERQLFNLLSLISNRHPTAETLWRMIFSRKIQIQLSGHPFLPIWPRLEIWVLKFRQMIQIIWAFLQFLSSLIQQICLCKQKLKFKYRLRQLSVNRKLLAHKVQFLTKYTTFLNLSFRWLLYGPQMLRLQLVLSLNLLKS